MIEIEGEMRNVLAFQSDIISNPPANAVIASVEHLQVAAQGDADFSIVKSDSDGDGGLAVAPDTAACPACIQEVFDPRDRRFRYPFNSCIDCGPRYSLALIQPFDRQTTSMKSFGMCRDCRREYEQASTRRFHSQINSCPGCGPRIRLATRSGAQMNCEDPLAESVSCCRP